ncbi:MAG: mannose-1-phosphate guanylyltransferase [Balneolales bacterium]
MVYALIMAGGIGSRFWPRSRKIKPKQFLSLIGDKSLLQNTVDRILPVIPIERILIITNDNYTELVKEQIPDIPNENIIGEPVARNTAPCIALASAILLNKDPEATLVVLPSDHYINDNKSYLKVLSAAIEKAQKDNGLVTIGIKPTRPETGYGYIQVKDKVEETDDKIPVHLVKTFAEKPDMNTALKFLESGEFLWNSGMFIWRAQTIFDQFGIHLPDLYKEAVKVKGKFKTGERDEAINEFYHNCISISIDYGIMEKAKAVHVVPGDFGWNDVGSWMAIYELDDKDKNGNVMHTENHAIVDSDNCYVSTLNDKVVALVGVQGVALIETKDALLLCRLDVAQDVKKIYEQLDTDQLEKFK